MTISPKLFCPVRGELQVSAKTKDGLTFSEEKRRIECIIFLLNNNYPKEYIRVEKRLINIGHKGKNSLRADIVVYDVPFAQIENLDLEEQRKHTLLIAEIKRDNKDALEAKRHQLEPALHLLTNTKAIGIYWDDIEQRLFYKKIVDNYISIIESPIAFLPEFGSEIHKNYLKYSDLKPSPSLIDLFSKIEDSIHRFIVDKSARYQIMLQLLLAKMHDEKSHKRLDTPMVLQDFSIDIISDEIILQKFTDLLQNSLNLYQRYLPNKVSNQFNLSPKALRDISKHLAPINLLEGNPDVIQNFYMYFAQRLYDWDLAQYFTPYEVIDFIVRIINPQYGETIKDPACGSADFLTCAYRHLSQVDDQAGDRVWGSDSSKQAVQISILNMFLNNDGKSNIREEDSLNEVLRDVDKYDILLCNPPFGIRIIEKQPQILAKFDLGKGKSSQETGILFTELCVKQARPNGRIAIILPNGYLGNKSERYVELRRWLLKHAYIVGIIAFPRFTFKKSGADVSASVVFLQKREKPLTTLDNIDEYPVYINLLENVGWEIGNKKAKKIYKREPSTGTILYDKTNQPILDADFDEILGDLYNSATINKFNWVNKDKHLFSDGTGWSINISSILNNRFQSLDPKRLNQKYISIINNIRKNPHLRLGDICEIIPEGFSKKRSEIYRYVELGDIHQSSYEYTEKYGWDLPSRAKHLAIPGDIFIGKIWGSVGKWMIASELVRDIPTVVTNGCYRLRLKDEYKNHLCDLIFALSSEFYRVQMRALATGSDGLAEISEDDLGDIIIPIIQDADVRNNLTESINKTIFTESSVNIITEKLVNNQFKHLYITPRKSQFSQV
jgi:type I restriction enzyme M protein